jgi:GTPase SAR1 family protein
MEDKEENIDSVETELIGKKTQRYDYLFKIVLLGDAKSGKTSLLMRYAEDKYLDDEDYMPTIGVDFKAKIVAIHDKTIKLQMW